MTYASVMKRFFFLFLIVFSLITDPVQAQEEDRRVQLRLTPERETILPGETLFIAIEQIIEEDWHTYWHNPGDSGEGIGMNWDLPDGFTAGPIKWPVPHKITIGPPENRLTSYGYEGRATMLQEITAPHELPEGPLTLTANIHLLVCADICIPEESTLSLTLNGGGEAGDNAAFIDAAYHNLPIAFNWPASVHEDGDDLVLTIPLYQPIFVATMARQIRFNLMPHEWGIVDNTADAYPDINRERIIVRQKRGDRALSEFEELDFVLAYEDHQGEYTAIELTANIEHVSAGTDTYTDVYYVVAYDDIIKLAQALVFALLGGLILNLMPCVFPVLSLKALKLCRLSKKEQSEARMHGFLYTFGILLTFSLIALTLILLKAAGAQIGWGFQLQNPIFVVLLAWLLFTIGLNLSGFFEISGQIAGWGSKLAEGDGRSASFFSGVLAVIVATPCTAPFMGAAMGYALSQPAPLAIAVFLALGLGLALPYLLLTLIPAFHAILPKPGAWMETFKEFLSFPLFASAAWLVWVLARQAGDSGVLIALTGMTAIAFGLWLLKKAPQKGWIRRGLQIFGVLILGITLVSAGNLQMTSTPAEGFYVQTEAFEPDSFADLEAGNIPLFVNMTAAWCITCQINEKVALSVPATKALFQEQGIVYVKGDWTNRDPSITAYLESFGRSGVPLYVYYGPRNQNTGQRPDPVILPQLLTPGIVRDAIEDKGGS